LDFVDFDVDTDALIPENGRHHNAIRYSMIINITPREMNALKSIDSRELDRLIEKAVHEEKLGPISQLPLFECGEYVAKHLRAFEDALRASANARSAKNIEDKRYRAISAGTRLSHAFFNMKARMEAEERNGELFFIDDHIRDPFTFSARMELNISYKWRRSIDEEWNHHRITFLHTVRERPNPYPSRNSRKLSAAAQSRELQKKLFYEWDHLKQTALYTLRDYFEGGGDGSKIPETFKVKSDPYDGSLNNQSAKFWVDDASRS